MNCPLFVGIRVLGPGANEFVLCQCKSGSGASLGASSAASLTGKCMSCEGYEAASLLGGTCVQRRFVSTPLFVMRAGACVYVLSSER